MDTNRRKKASLAINAILRGLELDQLVFRYDETARPDIGPHSITWTANSRAVASSSRARPAFPRTG